MAGFMDILGVLVKEGMSQSSNTRLSRGLGADKPENLGSILGGLSEMMTGGGGSSSGGGGLGDLLGSVMGKGGSSGGGGLGDILGSVLGNSSTGGSSTLSNLTNLAGALMGKGGGNNRSLGGGGLAMLASLALSALKSSGQNPGRTPRALLEPQTPEDENLLERDAEIIVKAMINAAKADGRIDQDEVEKIIGKLEQNGLTEEEKNLFIQEANKPMDTDELIAYARNEPDMAAQIYAASILAIELDTQAEQEYLNKLADGLGLNSQVTDYIKSTLGVAA